MGTLPFKPLIKDQTVVVTGGGGVLCGKMAETLAECGAKVAILDLRLDAAEKVAQTIRDKGYQAKGFACDVLNSDNLNEVSQAVEDTFGATDILINGAGGNHPKGTTTKPYFEKGDLESKNEALTTFFDLDPKGIEFVFNLNFLGTLLPTQTFSKGMISKGKGCIINVSSMNAFTPLTKIPAYSGAKAAISNFTQWLAVHFSKMGIRVNALAPGFFLTDQNRRLLTNEDESLTDRGNTIIQQTPMGRFGNADDLTGTLLWLVSEEGAGFVTGTIIPIDGGFSAFSGV